MSHPEVERGDSPVKHTARFILVLVLLLGLMTIAQSSLIGACEGDGTGTVVCPE